MDRTPFERNGANGAGDQLRFHAEAVEPGKELTELAVADQRLAANDGDVNRPEAANDDGGAHQIRAAIIGEPAEGDQRTEVFGLVRIASGAMQRTFPGDLEGEKGRVSAEDAAPNAQNLPVLHASPLPRHEFAGPG